MPREDLLVMHLPPQPDDVRLPRRRRNGHVVRALTPAVVERPEAGRPRRGVGKLDPPEVVHAVCQARRRDVGIVDAVEVGRAVSRVAYIDA